jgi:hypothetical protein
VNKINKVAMWTLGVVIGRPILFAVSAFSYGFLGAAVEDWFPAVYSTLASL